MGQTFFCYEQHNKDISKEVLLLQWEILSTRNISSNGCQWQV